LARSGWSKIVDVPDERVRLLKLLDHHRVHHRHPSPSAELPDNREMNRLRLAVFGQLPPCRSGRSCQITSVGGIQLTGPAARFKSIKSIPVKEHSHRPYAVSSAWQHRTVRRLADSGQQHCGLAGIPERKISIPSACVLHRSCTHASCGAGVTRGQGPLGGNCGMVQLRHAGCVPSDARIRTNVTRHFERRPQSEPRLGPGGFRRSQPADLARVRPTASRAEQLGPGRPITLRAMTAPPDQSTQGVHAFRGTPPLRFRRDNF
jgi:hypothetical protein